MPTAVYPLGTFEARSTELIITDAYVGNQHAILVNPAMNGIWHAFILADKGIHVALFAYHNEVISQHLDKIIELTNQISWTKIGVVPIDTATCTIADRDAYEPLDVEKAGHKIAGISAHQCFSNTANADGSYGYEDLLKILADKKHPEYATYFEWVGGELDPEAFDLEEINEILAQLT